MSWFAELAGKAENLLNNLDEQTGAALRNHNVKNIQSDQQNYHLEAGITRKRVPRNLKKSTIADVKNSPKRHSPTRSMRTQLKELQLENNKYVGKKSSPKKSMHLYDLNYYPKKFVHGDSEFVEYHGLRKRRHSLPSNLESINNDEWILKMQNLEVENAMLKNELHVVNKEMLEVFERLRKAVDGNDVVNEDSNKLQLKLENSEFENHKLYIDKEGLTSQMELLKKKVNEITKKEQSQLLEKHKLKSDIEVLKEQNKDLEERLEKLLKLQEEANEAQSKLENEYRHAQSTILELQSNLDKSKIECQRLEKDWETYKHRVKSMLHAKDKEIKNLEHGIHTTEDTRVLMEQLDSLKEERDELSSAIGRVRSECDSMKEYVSQVEGKHRAADRLVAALREALKEERAARARAETQCNSLGKELKSTQMETGQTIASLQAALRDKESELDLLRKTTSTIKTSDTSALNVADYDVTQDSAENDKIQYLTNTLVQKQSKIDKLLADNNMLRIQLDKSETRYKNEITNRKTHSVVNLQADCRNRRYSNSALTAISYRMGAVFKRHPLFRVFIVAYMICLHLWVLTVLLSSTPESYIPRPNVNVS